MARHRGASTGLVIGLIAGVALVVIAMVALLVAAIVPLVNMVKDEAVADVVREQILADYEALGERTPLPPGNAWTKQGPIYAVGNITREMVRGLAQALDEYDKGLKELDDVGYDVSTYSSEQRLSGARKDIALYTKLFADVVTRWFEIVDARLMQMETAAMDNESAQRIVREQKGYYDRMRGPALEQVEAYRKIETLLIKRLDLLWKYRRFVEEDSDGYATLKGSAPSDAGMRLRELDTAIEALWDKCKHLSEQISQMEVLSY